MVSFINFIIDVILFVIKTLLTVIRLIGAKALNLVIVHTWLFEEIAIAIFGVLAVAAVSIWAMRRKKPKVSTVLENKNAN